MNNTFSIIIPTYNEEENILKTLISIIDAINNNIDLYEIIIVDGNSTDKTIIIANKYLSDSKATYKVILNDKVTYPGEARNIGSDNSKYNNLIFIDCAITITQSFIIECQSKINSYDIVWFNSQFKFGSEIQRSYIRAYFVRKTNERYVRHFAIKKEVFKKVGYFRSDLRGAEDWLFYSKINKHAFNEYFSKVEGFYSGYPKNFMAFYKKWIIYYEHSVYANLYKKNILISLLQILFITFTTLIIYLVTKSILLSLLIALLTYIMLRTYFSFTRSKIKCISIKDFGYTIIASLILEGSRIIGVIKGVINYG